MLKERARLVATVLLIADLTAVAIAFFAAYWLRDSVLPWLGIRDQVLYPLRLYVPLLPIALTVWGLILWSSGAYRSHRTVSLIEEAWSIARASALGTLLLVLIVYALRLEQSLLGDDRLSRLWLLLFTLLAILCLLALRTLVRLLSRYVRSRGLNYRNVVIAGTGASAREVMETIEGRRHWGYRVAGFAHLRGEGADSFAGRPVLGSLEELPELLKDHVIDEVLVVVSRAELPRVEAPLLALEEQGVVVRLVLDLFPHAKARVEMSDLDGLPLLTFSTAPSNPLLLAVKRTMDLAISLLLLLIALPLMGLIALAIKATSKGGVLFRQTRCGLNGRRFTMYKFRTMSEGAETRRADLEHLNEMTGPVFKAKRDPRVTRFGRLLRRYSLDELPQLWNVVAGSMSLVGPRPPIPDEVDRYESWQRRRLSMRPGLTCLWQISGRNDLDFDRWMELDLQYIDNWSPALDLKILLKTVPVVLSGRGAS